MIKNILLNFWTHVNLYFILIFVILIKAPVTFDLNEKVNC